MKYGMLLGLFFLLSANAWSEGAEGKKTKSAIVEEGPQIVEAVDCKNGQDTRRLEVQTRDAGCVLLYTKFGKTLQIGQSRRNVELCRQKLHEVQANLEKAGHSCK